MKRIATIYFVSFITVFAGLRQAPAAPVALPEVVSPGNGAQWFVGRTGASAFAGTCSFSFAGFSIEDASLTTSSTTHGDAHDVAFPIFVDTALFDAGSTVDLTGTTITAGAVSMSGLDVTVEYLFATGPRVARILASFDNPTGATINATVEVPVNFGSDSATVIRGTSSGDTTFDTSDRWGVTSDSGPFDPVNTTVFFGPGSPPVTPTLATTTVFECAGPQGLGVAFDISVPPGARRSLMFFAGLGDITIAENTVAGALAAATLFDDIATIPAELLAGLTESEILNWRFDCGNGVVDAGEECDDGNPDDGDCCSSTCTLPTCTPFAKGLFISKESSGKEKMVAKFLKGPPLEQTDLGNPIDGASSYHLCILDDGFNLIGTYDVDRAGDTCSGDSADCWKAVGKDPPDGKGYRYKDKDLASDGILKLLWKAGAAGKSKAIIKGKGSGLTPVAAALQSTGFVTMQLHASDGPTCIESSMFGVRKQDADFFKAK